MIKLHIPTETYGFVELEYQTMDEFDNNYAKDYVAIKIAQHNANVAVAELNKPSPKLAKAETDMKHPTSPSPTPPKEKPSPKA